MQWPVLHDILEAFAEGLPPASGAEERPSVVVGSSFCSAFRVEAPVTSITEEHVALSRFMSAIGTGPHVNP